MSISEQQNYYLEKVKQRNEKILEISGKPFAATANPPDPGLTTVEKARLSAERQLRELSNQHPRSRKTRTFSIEDSKRRRESVTSKSTLSATRLAASPEHGRNSD